MRNKQIRAESQSAVVNKPRGLLGKPLSAVGRLVRSPAFNVCLLAVLILSVFIAARLLRNGRSPAQLSFIERSGEVSPPQADPEQNATVPSEIFQGEVYDTAVRLRETAAVGVAISLALFAEAAEKGSVPANIETVWTSVQNRALLPPDLEINKGELSSPSSKFVVRYQAIPLRFEVVSHPKPEREGPALMFRFPLPVTNGKAISYFQSSIARRFEVPAPFTAAEQLLTNGWTLEQWRGELLPRDERILRMLSEEKSVWSNQR